MTGATASSGRLLDEMIEAVEPIELGMSPTTSVFCRFTFDGVHHWPGAGGEPSSYLKHPHRHVFHVELELPVEDDDRSIEFIYLKEVMRGWLDSWYGQLDDTAPSRKLYDLGETSCETIARKLAVKALSLWALAGWCQVSVSEDGENGAKVLEVR